MGATSKLVDLKFIIDLAMSVRIKVSCDLRRKFMRLSVKTKLCSQVRFKTNTLVVKNMTKQFFFS